MRFYSLVLIPRNRKEMEINRLLHCIDPIVIKNRPDSTSPLFFASMKQYRCFQDQILHHKKIFLQQKMFLFKGPFCQSSVRNSEVAASNPLGTLGAKQLSLGNTTSTARFSYKA